MNVIHIMEPTYVGLKAALLSATLKSSMKKLAITGDSGEPMATPSICKSGH